MGFVLGPFLKSGFNFGILQASGNLPEEIDRLQICVVGVANNEAPSFRKIPERSSIPGVLLSSKFLSILNTLSDLIFENSNLQIALLFNSYLLIVFQNYLEVAAVLTQGFPIMRSYIF